MRKLLLTFLIFGGISSLWALNLKEPPKLILTTFGKASSNTLNPDSISVLNWNIYKGGKETFRYWFAYLAKDKDILNIQEMYLTPELKTFFTAFRNKNIMATSFMTKDKIRTGVMTASHVSANKALYLLSPDLEPITNTPKATLFTYYPIKDRKNHLLVVNIHGINFVKNRSFEDQITQVFSVLQNHHGPIIFMGDFNTWNKERLNFLNALIFENGLNEIKFSPDERTTFNENPLDHVFYTNDLVVENARVIGDINGSDHKPIVFNIKYIGK